jgi:hypothetical protein
MCRRKEWSTSLRLPRRKRGPPFREGPDYRKADIEPCGCHPAWKATYQHRARDLGQFLFQVIASLKSETLYLMESTITWKVRLLGHRPELPVSVTCMIPAKD